MKYFLYLFLYLNIYTLFSESLEAQNISLETTAESESGKTLIDSVLTTSEFANYKSLQSELDSISNKLYHLGYLDQELLSTVRPNDTVVIAAFELGNQWKQLIVNYTQENFSKEEVDRISDKTTDSTFTIPFTQIETSLSILNKIQIEKGHPFGQLQLIQLTKLDTTSISATLSSSNGTQRTIDQLVIKGYEKFPISFLKYFAGVKKGKKFKQSQLIVQNELLNNLGFVKTVKPPEALFRKDSTSIYFYLEKTNNNLFDGIIGFATNELTQNLEFNGYLNLDLNNNLNFGEQLLVNYKADGREQVNFRVKTTMPYLFKTPISASLELKIFKRDSTFSTTDQQARILYQITPESSTSVGYKTYESTNLMDEVLAGDPVQDYKSNFVTAGITFTKRQTQNFFPIKTMISLDTEIGDRTLTAIKDSQYRISSDINYSFFLNYRNSIFLRNTTSLLSSSTYVTNELYRFGGVNSIRGFSENSIDASLFSILNTEYRYVFNSSTYIHSIIDLGYFENKILELKEELFSFGIGLGLQTDAGIFRFNIANGISGEQNFKFSNTKIHLSLSSKF